MKRNFSSLEMYPNASFLKADTLKRIAALSSAFLILLFAIFIQSTKADSPFANSKAAANLEIAPIIIYPWEPIISEKILPFTNPIPAKPGTNITITACRGEYEPASFIIQAVQSVMGIHLSASNLTDNKGNSIPASAVDIRLVKCWYQAGDGTILKTDKRVLLPELLLKDDELVKVDYGQRRNYLKVTIQGQQQYIGNSLPEETIPEDVIIKDADELRPFNLDAESNKQIWITVHVPEDAISGKYEGTVQIKTDGANLSKVNLTVNVLPFELKAPFIEYAIYYRAKLRNSNNSNINSEFKSIDQYLAELKNLKKHGINYPTIYQPMDQMLGVALSLRKQAGLPNDHIYSLGLTTGNPVSATGLGNLASKVSAWRQYALKYGYKDLYVYGIDEAKDEKLLSERPAWEKVRKSGAKVFVACYEQAADTMADILDIPILLGVYKTAAVEKFHAAGKRVFLYGNPQVGIERPAIYRKNFGLGLACAKYDGAMDYAYQHSFGNIWNDFDDTKYRDHVFAYPTSNGVVDTIQWEGFREAVDDVRYLSTLISLKGGKKEQTLSWLSSLIQEQTDMKELKESIIEEILKTSNLNNAIKLRIKDSYCK